MKLDLRRDKTPKDNMLRGTLIPTTGIANVYQPVTTSYVSTVSPATYTSATNVGATPYTTTGAFTQ